MSAPETTSIATRSNQGTVAPKEALKLRLDLNLEVEIAIQAKVNGDITLSLLYVDANISVVLGLHVSSLRKICEELNRVFIDVSGYYILSLLEMTLIMNLWGKVQ
ncbi:uncharacterized protein BT62DRAFT_919468 [Guyanagaster necrorhizus]|uniref:Uncharacterized protein n=1 Tax=Guyanagaster necrorhizus TaxID=856835 RepID=A0A9P7VW26_9AGAR|nr:uncharacterized protein BT62DRAFT_919468 [Guyanagaster necrorhizus MCA 3950]KAG7446936.1 hypothetical protein BT62DRAFT_919468 [Guyanagaster necrorhizus MCA 3950]